VATNNKQAREGSELGGAACLLSKMQGGKKTSEKLLLTEGDRGEQDARDNCQLPKVDSNAPLPGSLGA